MTSVYALPGTDATTVAVLENPDTGGDGPGYLVQNAVPTQTTQPLATTQETAEVLPDAQQTAQLVPDESAGQIKLQIPNAPGEPVALPSRAGAFTTGIIAVITAVLLASGLVVRFIVAKKRKKKEQANV